jgi:hypothetical protein
MVKFMLLESGDERRDIRTNYGRKQHTGNAFHIDLIMEIFSSCPRQPPTAPVIRALLIGYEVIYK